ncbi:MULTISPECIES: hypothetical protein [Flavobacterium]|uniref:hypothetical protein n=1 Tax=Flavobacterium TaxID=237 RepID=UPI001FCB8438|nr:MULTISPECIES: hypothetical protein [Flavobacterium]UOK41606.1 hypothetical protein LZF87_09815 [Flavobacterium enshiense]
MEWFGDKNPQLLKAGGTLAVTLDKLNENSMFRKLPILCLSLLMFSCSDKTRHNKSNVIVEQKTEKTIDSIYFKNILEVINDKNSVPWVKFEKNSPSSILHFNLENPQTLSIEFTPECWAHFPIEIIEKKIVVYWDVNIDSKYNFDIVKAMNKIDKTLKGKPFIILELQNGNMLKANYQMKELRDQLNNTNMNDYFFADEFYATGTYK